MRFPLSHDGGHGQLYRQATRFRPNPEWQKNGGHRARRVQSVPHRLHPDRRGARKPHPMINKRFPLVMMLEPLHACNLTCTGCGRIREYESTIRERCRCEQCLKAVDECGAPMVSICGGEPMLYPEIGPLVAETGATRTRPFSSAPTACSFKSGSRSSSRADKFYFNVHLDGMEKNHDIAVEREGVFREAIEGVKAAKAGRFQGLHQHHGLQRDRHERDRGDVRISGAVQGGRPHDFAGVRLFGRQRSRDLHDARRCPRKVQEHRQAGRAVSLIQHAHLPRIPARASAIFPARPGAIRPTT